MNNVVKYSKSPTIFGTGLLALDIVVGADPNEPAYQWAGGTCGNVLTILSYLGWCAFPVARTNDEPSSERVRNDLKKWGIRLDYCSLEPTASVPVITQEISRDKDGKPAHKFHWRNCPKCGSWLPNYKPVTLAALDDLKETTQHSDVFFFDRTSAGALDLAAHFKELGAIIVFEPSAKGDPKHFERAVSLSDVIKYSDQRFASLTSGLSKTKRPTLEIQTLGSEGLRYRHYKHGGWHQIAAFDVDNVKDTCGCGDWTTAGIISELCRDGSNVLKSISLEKLEDGIRYGQALGAWNCRFEGARGGMYRVSIDTFKRDIRTILSSGRLTKRTNRRRPDNLHSSDGMCPACPSV